MIKRITAGIGAAALAVTAFALPASAAARPVDWTQRTCSAFAAYEAHPTAGRLVTLGTDSLHVAWKYLGADVWQLVNDVHAQPEYVRDDEQYAYEDCHNGSGL